MLFGSISYPKRTLDWLGLSVRTLRFELLKRGRRSRSYQQAVIGRRDPEDLGSFEIEESDVGEGEIYPCCVEAEMTPSELKEAPETRKRLLKKWYPLVRSERERVGRLFERTAPEAVLLVQGYEPTNWAARREAIRRGFAVVAVENTALNDRLVWEAISGITVNRNAAANYYWRFRESVREDEVESSVRAMVLSTGQRKSNDHRTPDTPAEIERDRPVVLFLGQVYTDSSVLFGSGAWRSPIDVVEQTLSATQEAGARLIIKLHPKEWAGKAPVVQKPYANLTYRRMLARPGLKEEIERGNDLTVDHENKWNTYDLIRRSDVVVTINSQAGLEAAIRGVPTIVCGQAFYGALGFTHQAPEAEALRRSVGNVLRTGRDEEWEYQSRVFAHVFYEKYCIRKSEAQVARLVCCSARGRFQRA